VFDPQDSSEYNFLGSIADGLHWMTKDRVIRAELLFKEGDVYDPSLVYETERNLRALGIIGDVDIRCDTVGADSVHVTVTTHDKWTLGLNTGYKQEGGNTSFYATLKEDNLFGAGQKLSVGYNYSDDRRNPHGAEVIFFEPRSFGTRWKTKLQYKNSEEEKIRTVLVEHPLYADTAEFFAGLYADEGRMRIRQYQAAHVKVEDYFAAQNFQAWGGHSWGYRQKFRVGAAYIRTRTEASVLPLRVSDNTDLINISLSVMERDFYRGKYIDNFGRVEDVPLGRQASVIFGKGFHATASSSADYYVRASWQQAFGIDERYYVGYTGMISSFIAQGEPAEMKTTLGVTQHMIILPRYTIAARFLCIVGRNWAPSSQLLLGAQTGLRGYSTYEFSGNRELLFNIEHRLYPDLTFWIFRIGGTLFFDSGAVWSQGDSQREIKSHSAVGFGLRIENTKAQGSGIIRIDFAFNLDRRRFAQVIFSSDQLFRGTSELEFVPPNVIF